MDRPFEPGVGDVRVDFGRRDASVTERALYQSNVAGLFVKASGKGVAQAVNRVTLDDASGPQPLREPKLNLTGLEPHAGAGGNRHRRKLTLWP